MDELLAGFDANALYNSDKAEELYRLYRLASGDLAFMQSRTGHPAHLEFLEDLVSRAHFRLSPPPKAGLASRVFRVLRYDFPAAVLKERKALLASLAIFAAGLIFGAVAVLLRPDSKETFLAAFPHLLEQSPSADAAQRSVSSVGPQQYFSFSLYLFLHNLRIAFFCFALGITYGIGTTMILFANGVILGCTAALYAQDGVFLFFLSWVGPHGALEIPAIIIASMAGLLLARAQLSGGPSFWRAITARKRELIALLGGTAFMLALAGSIEGGFSQTNAPGMITVKIGVAAACFVALLVWLFASPRSGGSHSQRAL